MGWSIVQHKESSSSTAVFTSNTTTHNQIVITNASDQTISSISISPGSGTFSAKKTLSAAGLVAEVWECPDVTGGTTPTVTITWSATPSFPNWVAYEFNGGDTGGSTDGTNSNNATNTSLTTNSITTTINGDLVVKSFCVGGAGTGTAESGWTEINPMIDGNISGYIVQSTAGSITGTDTQNNNTQYTGVIVALKPPSGALPNVNMQFTLGITPLKLVALLPTSMKFLLGITPLKLVALLNSVMQFKMGITAVTIREIIGNVNLQFKLGISSISLKALLSNNMVAHIGITPLTVTGGGAPQLVTIVFTDGGGVHRVAQINPLSGD